MTWPPLERYLNWVPETTPTLPKDHCKENLPPVEEPRKLPRKMRPHRRKKEHHQHPGTSGSLPGTSQSPNPTISASVKHPQPFQHPQHPQPPRSAANHNSARPNLLDQAELGRLYKLASSSISKESITRSRQDYFSGSNLPFTCSQQSHRDYFSGSPSGHLNKNWTLTDPCRGASTDVSERTDPAQTPPRAALPDVRLDAGVEPPEAAATSSIPHAKRPPVVLEIPGSIPEPSELRLCPDKPAVRIQDCQEDCVTTANSDAVLRKCQDYWSFKTASRQPPDSFQKAARLPYDGYDSVVTVLRQRHE